VSVAAFAAGGCHKPPVVVKQTGPLPVNSFTRAWGSTVELPKKDAISEIHVRDTTIYVYSKSGQVNGLSRDTGVLQFTYHVKNGGSELRPPIVLKDSIVYPTLMTLEVYAPDGRFTRSVSLPFAIRTDASGAGQYVYLCGDYPKGGARVAKVDVKESYVPVRWDFIGVDAGRLGFSSGTQIVGDIVYAAGRDGNVYAVNANTRERIWPTPEGVFSTGGAIDADLVADTSGVYVASTDSILYVLNANTGKLRWRYFAGVPLREGPVVTSDRVYLKVPGKGIVAFSKTEGKDVRDPLWTRDDVNQIVAQDATYAYGVSKDNHLLALDKSTGETRFKSQRHDFAQFGVNNKDDGTIFAATKDGTVLAIKGIFKPGIVGEQVRNDATDGKWEAVAVAMR
jgi:outer membrane protein assembly factor BamB